MSNKDYYELLLRYKAELALLIEEDATLQNFAQKYVGIKPQGTAIDMVARVYAKYCQMYNVFCDLYDQMEQVQRRFNLKTIIDTIACRIMELKTTLENVENFQYTYHDNALIQMVMIPHEVQILCPFFYPFEIREKENQYIVEQILAGNRLGDPEPTQEELEAREAARLEEERIKAEEAALELQRKIAMGEDIEEVEEVQYTPEQLEAKRLEDIHNKHVNNIQRMERGRYITMYKILKARKDINLYLDLAGLKKPQAREGLRKKAANLIHTYYRKFMELKREHMKEFRMKMKLEMVIPAYQPPSQKIQLEKVRAKRREFRQDYYEKWLKENIKQKSRILELKRDAIIDDITEEIKSWLIIWYKKAKTFDEYPWPEEGGSILIVTGQTFTVQEYQEWESAESKRLKKEAQNPKSKEQIKAEKIAAKEEKKRLALEAKERERKRIIDYKKQRLNPDSDPGIYIDIGANVKAVLDAWATYQSQWRSIDMPDPSLDAIRGYIKEIITECQYQDINLELRPLVDEVMRLEHALLKAANKKDYDYVKVPLPISQKRKRPRKPKVPKPDKILPKAYFQQAVDAGLVVKYPRTTLEDYWGDRNYAAADERIIPWTPKFSPPAIGDLQELVRVRCLLPLGAECPKVQKTQLLVGPKSSGKRSLIYAIATETNSILIDLSPLYIYDKLPGAKGLKKLFQLVNKVSRLMQPTIIMVGLAEKMFYKKVPSEEAAFDPTRLSKDFFKEIVKGIKPADKMMVLATASEPWLAKTAQLKKCFPECILVPKSDFGSLCDILTKTLMRYHGISRDFDISSMAQALRGFNANAIRNAIASLLSGKRLLELKYKPLDPMEILNAVLEREDAVYTDNWDYNMFQTWYFSYSPFGEKYNYYMFMLASQYEMKLKKDKKKK